MKCDACAPLGDEVEIANSAGEPQQKFPPAFDQLDQDLKAADAYVCSSCHACFVVSTSSPGGSEDFQRTWVVETLRRVDVATLQQHMRGQLARLAHMATLAPVFGEQRAALLSAWLVVEAKLQP